MITMGRYSILRNVPGSGEVRQDESDDRVNEMSTSIAQHEFVDRDVAAAIEFLKRTRFELRELRMVRVWPNKLHVMDINGDYFEVLGVGFEDEEIVPILNHVNTNFNPKTIHTPCDDEYKQFKTGRRRAWAEDRVM